MKKINSLLILTFTLLLFACGNEKEVKETEVYQIRNIGTLSTVEYTLGKVIKWNDKGDWYDFGDRKILISVKAKVKGGIDLKKINEGDIKVSGKKIEITIPQAEIIVFDMDPELAKVEREAVSGMRAGFSLEEKNNILRKGQKSIESDIKKLGILNDARNNAHVFLKDFYTNLGFEEVIIYDAEESKRD